MIRLADYRDAKQLMAIREFMIERGIVMSADGEALLRELVHACRPPDEAEPAVGAMKRQDGMADDGPGRP